jgi:hypothetical protein
LLNDFEGIRDEVDDWNEGGDWNGLRHSVRVGSMWT